MNAAKLWPVALLALALIGCGPKDQFSEANALLKSGVASDVTVTPYEGQETRHPHIDGTYSVCGWAHVQSPTEDRSERFIVNVRDGRGIGYFDGGDDPDLKAQFEAAWTRLCGPNSAHETFTPTN